MGDNDSMRSAEPDTEVVRFNPNAPHPARVYDYWLGGKDNYAADRELGESMLAANPGLRIAARANRAFLARTVRYLAADAGIRQFLDIGTGLPTANNTHEVAQSVAPESRVVYVDNDPIVLSHARALLTSRPEGCTAYIDADLGNTGSILADAAATLDFARPVAVVLLAVLHFIPDADDPGGIVAALMSAVPPGSYLVISHITADFDSEVMTEAIRRFNDRAGGEAGTLRSRAEILRFFDGLRLVEPGLVRIPEWRPGSEIEASAAAPLWGGVARKP